MGGRARRRHRVQREAQARLQRQVTTKLSTIRDAVARFIPDGASVALGTALEPAIPFALVHELIRQKRRDLELIGPISDIAFDQLIGAGCVATVHAAWVGNVSAGLAHAYRRAMEQGIPRTITVRDHSNFTMAQSLLAGALGAPFIPTRTLLGSDIPRANGTFIESRSPIDGTPLLLIPALLPDVAVIAVQRSDDEGNAHLWGPWGVSQEAALAARAVIVVADEVVPRSVIASDPNRTMVPGHKVVAVVAQEGACHPSPLQGRYGRDHDFYHEYHERTRTAKGFEDWIAEWVTGVTDRDAYLTKLGARWTALRETGTPAAEARF